MDSLFCYEILPNGSIVFWFVWMLRESMVKYTQPRQAVDAASIVFVFQFFRNPVKQFFFEPIAVSKIEHTESWLYVGY